MAYGRHRSLVRRIAVFIVSCVRARLLNLTVVSVVDVLRRVLNRTPKLSNLQLLSVLKSHFDAFRELCLGVARRCDTLLVHVREIQTHADTTRRLALVSTRDLQVLVDLDAHRCPRSVARHDIVRFEEAAVVADAVHAIVLKLAVDLGAEYELLDLVIGPAQMRERAVTMESF